MRNDEYDNGIILPRLISCTVQNITEPKSFKYYLMFKGK